MMILKKVYWDKTFHLWSSPNYENYLVCEVDGEIVEANFYEAH